MCMHCSRRDRVLTAVGSQNWSVCVQGACSLSLEGLASLVQLFPMDLQNLRKMVPSSLGAMVQYLLMDSRPVKSGQCSAKIGSEKWRIFQVGVKADAITTTWFTCCPTSVLSSCCRFRKR